MLTLATLAGRAAAQEPADAPAVPRFLLATPAEDAPPHVDLFREELRLRAWLERGDNRARVNEDARRIHGFHALEPARGGPLSGVVRWYPHVLERPGDPGSAARTEPLANRDDLTTVRLWDTARPEVLRGRRQWFVEFLALDLGAEHFTSEDLAPGSPSVGLDERGGPALRYSIARDRKADYRTWTADRVGTSIVTCIDGYATGAPRIMAPITGGALVTGNFDQAEVKDLVDRIAHGDTEQVVPEAAWTREETRAVIDATKLVRTRTAEAVDAGERVVTFDDLAAWAAGPIQAPVRDDVVLIGFPFPLGEENDSIDLLLVESPWDCAFAVPPGPDRVVHVTVRSIPPPRHRDLQGRIVRIEGRLLRRDAPEEGATSSRAASRARFRMEATALRHLDR